jgi:hypothetical protein
MAGPAARVALANPTWLASKVVIRANSPDLSVITSKTPISAYSATEGASMTRFANRWVGSQAL